jgi:ribosomal-protein-alanine N-acetyltransferase
VPRLDPMVETPRLVLREIDPTDIDFVASMLADPEVMRFYPRCCSREDSEDWIRRQQDRYARDGHGFWLALEKSSGRPIGQVGLLMVSIDDVVEPALGYLIHRPFWRRGFATEAAAACRDHALGALGKARVICPIRPENTPSQGVARKIGMRQEKRAMFGGFEHLIFSVTRGDPPAAGQPEER